jgi:hypothetical protein
MESESRLSDAVFTAPHFRRFRTTLAREQRPGSTKQGLYDLIKVLRKVEGSTWMPA